MAVLTGTSAPEALDGTAGADSLIGLGGDDTLNGGAGNDVLTGGVGNDTFVLGGHGFGVDAITDFAAGDVIDVSALGIANFATLQPFLGLSAFGDATLSLTFDGVIDRAIILGMQPSALSAAAFVFNASLAGLDSTGTANADLLFGGSGYDRLSGGGGADTLMGGAGADTLIGGMGNATLTGGAGEDRFVIEHAASGARVHTITDFSVGDVLDLSGFGVTTLADLLAVVRVVSGSGPGGTDVSICLTVQGKAVNVLLQGTSIAALTEAQFIFDTDATARDLTGTVANDVLFGAAGNDTLVGGNGDDTLIGGDGDDQIVGGLLSGGGQADVLIGGAGDDTLAADDGSAVLTGGAGSDVFILFPNYIEQFAGGHFWVNAQHGDSVITDLSAGDRVDLSGALVPDLPSLLLIAQQIGNNVEINFGDVNLGLLNATLAGLRADQFIFATPAAAGRNIAGGYSDGVVIFGGEGADTISGWTSHAKLFGGAGDDIVNGGMGSWLFGQDGNDTLIGAEGNDTLDGGSGDNMLNGGPDEVWQGASNYQVVFYDTASYRDFTLAQLAFSALTDTHGNRTGLIVQRFDSPGGVLLGTDTLIEIERIETSDFLVNLGTGFEGLFASSNRLDNSGSLLMGTVYSGPVEGLAWQLLGSDTAEIFGGTDQNDFINAQGGDDAVDSGSGDDVIDGGTGSNFLTGGWGKDIFFLDGRGGSTTWSTITDWGHGALPGQSEQLSIWGFRPGISVLHWFAEDGAAGYRGVTLHADLDGNGVIDTSVTWSGRTQAYLPTPHQYDGLLWFT